jgi:type IV pilus assembly protein PilA
MLRAPGPALKEFTDVKKMQKNEGFTLIELLIVVAIIGIIAAIAVPGLLRARMSGNEASAIGSLRAVNTAQQNYTQFCFGYATSLQDLGFQPAGSNQPYLSPDMTGAAPVQKSGYTFVVLASVAPAGVAVANGNAACPSFITGYYGTGTAMTWGTTGTREFATDTAGTIWQNTANAAPTQPFATAGSIRPIQ